MSKLDCDYVDLLLVHWPNQEVPFAETMEAASQLLEEGKARFIGVSNFIRPRLVEAIESSPIPLLVNQVEYHPYLKQTKLLETCRSSDVLLTAYSPLGQGAVLLDETLLAISEQYGRSVSQICLRWLLQQGIAAIPKSSSPARLRENLAALDFELDEVAMGRIDAIPVRKRVIDWWPGAFDLDPES